MYSNVHVGERNTPLRNTYNIHDELNLTQMLQPRFTHKFIRQHNVHITCSTKEIRE